MADDDKMKRAAEIDAAVKKADAEKKADADTEAGPTLADIMSAVKACSDAMTSMGARMDAIEAAGKGGDKDGDDLVDEGKARQAAVDARKRADGADTPEMRQQRAEAQMRADAVCTAWGERAPAPLHLEPLTAYRLRLAEPWKKHSPAFRDLDLDALVTADAAVLDVAERQIFADATAAARSPDRVQAGHLLMVEKRLDGGHVMRTFQGHPRSWMDNLAGPVRQFVTSGLLSGEGALSN